MTDENNVANLYLDNIVKRGKYYYRALGVCTAVGLVTTGIGVLLQEYGGKEYTKFADTITSVGAGLVGGGIIGALYLASSHIALKGLGLEDEVNKID